MKSLLIILGFCVAFITASIGIPELNKPLNTEFRANQQCNIATQNNKRNISFQKQNKSGKLPRWHRLLPGMFR